MTDSGAIKPRLPAYKKEGDYAPPPPAVLNGGGLAVATGTPSLKIRAIEEPPRAESDTLVSAVAKIYQVVTAKIAYHEREAQKLRDSLKPFAAISPRPSVATENEISADAIRAVLNIADQLNLTGESKP